MNVTCALCGEPLHRIADNRLDEFIWVGRDGKPYGNDSDLARLFDPARNPLGVSDPYDALSKMADRLNRADKARRTCRTRLYWQIAREYSALKVRLEMAGTFHQHWTSETPPYTGEVPEHCGWPMWLRPSGWQCRQCKERKDVTANGQDS